MEFPEEMMFDLFHINTEHAGEITMIRMITRHFRKCKSYNSLVAHMLNIISMAIIQSKMNLNNSRDTDLFDLCVDMSGTEYKNVDIGFFRKILKTFLEQFPNMLRRCEIYNAPGFFPAVYKILSPILPKETREKIHIIKKKGNSVSMPSFPTSSADLN
jgi:hypothetical protein